MISVLQLGLVEYTAGLSLQRTLVELRKQQRVGDVLLLLEHAPVITLGRNAKTANVLASPEQLAARGIQVFECDRGGDVTFHGPGQLVGYPIFDLYGFPSSSSPGKHLGAIEYVRRVEEVLIRTCADLGVATERIAGLTGVWTKVKGKEPETAASAAPKPPTPPAKIAALGVHISRGVTSHGFALNVTNDLSFFNLIIPCGISSKPVTSLEMQLHQLPTLKRVAQSVSRHFGDVFERRIVAVDSLDALHGEPVSVPPNTQSSSAVCD